MPPIQEPATQNDKSCQTTYQNGQCTYAPHKYFGWYFLIFDLFLTAVAYLITLAMGYVVVVPVLIFSYAVVQYTFTNLMFLIESIYSHLCRGLCFLMFHCHVTFISVFVAVTMIWFVLAVLISFSDHERLLLLTIYDD